MKVKFFDLTRALSKHSEHAAHKHGAVIVDKNRIVSVGFNRMKTSPRSPHIYHQIHAEMSAIFKSRVDLDGCSLYVGRATKDGKWAESRPCSACMEVIKAAGIKRIYYSTSSGFKGETL